MAAENTAGAETAAGAATGETEATLEQMQADEAGEATGGGTTKEPAEPTEKVKEEKVVPLAALHEERNARKELQRQVAERDRKHAEQLELVNRRLEILANPQRQVQVPDKVEQPVDYLDHQLQELRAQNKAILDRDQERDQQSQNQAAYQRVAQAVVHQRTAFEKEAPDFGDAITHLNSVRTRQLVMLGASEEQAAMRASQELDNAALQWASEGRNAAQTAYEFAKTSGYTPKAQQQQAQATPAEKIAAQQKGTAAARSLGGGGSPNAGKLTA